MFHPDGPTFWELARQALSSTTRGYDLLAPKFDVTPFRTPDAILRKSADYICENLRPRCALDLCCGTGAMLEWLPPGSVGLDASRGMLTVARRLGQDQSLVRASALKPPFRAAFDLVTCFSALGHFVSSEHAELVAAVKSCLRPGGHFLFVTGSMPSKASPDYWMARGFNAAIRVRNTFWSPPFVMYYLTFLLPEATSLLESAGFRVHVAAELGERLVLVDAELDSPTGRDREY